MKYLLLLAITLSMIFTFKVAETHAVGAKVSPLLYEAKIDAGEVKKGYIDISNPNDATTTFSVELESFKQVNNRGELAFESASDYSLGIKFDYDEFTLEPRESLRLYFIIDSDKLPKGGVYATVFFRTIENGVVPDLTSIQPSTRVGTLLMIENGGGGAKRAEISSLEAPFFQIGKSIKVDARVKNTGGENGLAFFPKVTAKLQPFGSENTKKSKLLFPEIERTTPLVLSGSYLGFLRVKAVVGENEAYTWIFAATGWGRLLAVILLTGAVGLLMWWNSTREKSTSLPENTKD